MKKRRVISPTGVVHAVEGQLGQEYNTTCNYVNVAKWHGMDNYHYWKLTDKPVTCKNCLKILNPYKPPKQELMKEALEDIRDLAVGYDGFSTEEGLKSLIDDMQNVAVKALNNEKWSTHIPSGKET